MIIRFEKLPDHPNLRVVEPTWRGDSADLVVHEELSKAIEKLWGKPVEPGELAVFDISASPLIDSEMFTIVDVKKGLPGARYTNRIAGLQFICELLLFYVPVYDSPQYPAAFYVRKHE